MEKSDVLEQNFDIQILSQVHAVWSQQHYHARCDTAVIKLTESTSINKILNRVSQILGVCR